MEWFIHVMALISSGLLAVNEGSKFLTKKRHYTWYVVEGFVLLHIVELVLYESSSVFIYAGAALALAVLLEGIERFVEFASR